MVQLPVEQSMVAPGALCTLRALHGILESICAQTSVCSKEGPLRGDWAVELLLLAGGGDHAHPA